MAETVKNNTLSANQRFLAAMTIAYSFFLGCTTMRQWVFEER
ncbi:hypothetical protein ABN584_17800 [Gloeocapsa sp. BRSZ]|nr:hypothetical protein [Gloeocapsa sp. PCC 7428]